MAQNAGQQERSMKKKVNTNEMKMRRLAAGVTSLAIFRNANIHA